MLIKKPRFYWFLDTSWPFRRDVGSHRQDVVFLSKVEGIGILDFAVAEGGAMEPIRVAVGSWVVGRDVKVL